MAGMRRPLSFLLVLAAIGAAPLSSQAQSVAGGEGVSDLAFAAQPFVHSAPAPIPAGIARYGPFRVIDGRSAALVAATDEYTPAQFAAMMRDYPQIARLELVECPGTYEDRANLRLGRMIRAAGLVTHVPRGGSVRSGAVELFLAGAERLVDEGAEFAVHSWVDEDGLQANDYAENAPESRKYLVYYQEMGMDAATARKFYAMTNSVPFGSARWFGSAEMRHWLGQGAPAAPSRPSIFGGNAVLAYLDLEAGLN